MSLSKARTFFFTHKLATILAVGIAVRLVLMPVSAHPFDIYVWYNVSESILRNGPLFLQGFPPLWYHYMMVPVAYSYSALSTVLPTGTIAMSNLPTALNFYPSYSIAVVPGMLFDFVVKIPFLISDIAVAVLLYKTVEEQTPNKHLAWVAAALWFLNPYVIWISAGWGMWDTLPALFSLAALFLLVKKRFAFSAVSLSLAVALKLYPIMFLVPIAFFLYKTYPAGARLKSLGRFMGVFSATSLVLFLPYLGAVANFVSDFFLLQSGGTNFGAVTPLGPYSFGLTYWAPLSRLLPATGSFEFLVSAVSLALFVVALALVYWYSSKLRYEQPLLELSVTMLFCVAALFLTYRIVSEQWFVWALPFLIVLFAVGRVRGALFWAASGVALLFAVLNCPLPFFFLPLVPWAIDGLVGMVYVVWWLEPLRVAGLAVLSCMFSLLLLYFVWKLRK
ncbi:MAG: hypothetical protein ACQCN6_07535 [Candidatus Bathyarchaeia archaeon]